MHESSFDNLHCGSDGDNGVERAGDLFSSNEGDNNNDFNNEDFDNLSNKA